MIIVLYYYGSILLYNIVILLYYYMNSHATYVSFASCVSLRAQVRSKHKRPLEPPSVAARAEVNFLHPLWPSGK